jgi:hypothetical protein
MVDHRPNPGGSAHNRAVARVAGKNDARPEVVSNNTVKNGEPPNRETFRLRPDFSLTLALCVMTLILTIIPPSTRTSAVIWIVVLIATSVYPIFHISYWLTRKQKRWAYAITTIMLLAGTIFFQQHFWRNFHSLLLFSAEPDLLASTTRDSNPIRLSVANVDREPIQNLDLTVAVLDKSDDYLRGMRQMSNVPGVWIRGPAVPDATAWIKGTNGQPFALSSQDTINELPVGRHWFASCPRLTPGSSLRLAIGTSTKDQKLPKGLRVSGDYEVVESGGIRVVVFDEVVNIKYPSK